MTARTLFEKIWEAHVVVPETEDTPAVLYVDLHLLHEVTSPQAFSALDARGLRVRSPERALATLDHATPTTPPGPDGRWTEIASDAARQIDKLRAACSTHGIQLLDVGSGERGIVHVVGPELGATQPGRTIVCGDSHTSTHGAFGALAFGIGTTEVGHVLATQSLLQRRPKTMAVTIEGERGPGVAAKDIALAVIAKLGVGGGAGHVLEFRGSTVTSLSMEERMTLCNLAIEAGARAGMVAPDDATFTWLEGRALAPCGVDWEHALDAWRRLPTDPEAVFDAEVELDVSALAPTVTWGTTPGMSCSVDGAVPAPRDDTEAEAQRYMGLEVGDSLAERPIDVVFVGSCTNGRLSDLREAAAVMRGRNVAAGVRMLVVPGSDGVRRAAEAEGLDSVFTEAGAEWREPGCSMCIAMNGDVVPSGRYAVSTSNRNFAGRQGPGARTFLASPATAAASAVAGRVVDPRPLLREAIDA